MTERTPKAAPWIALWSIALAAVLLAARVAAAGDPVLLLTERAKPLSYLDGDRIRGIAADIVETALDDAQIEHRTQMLPWSRAYRQARDEPGTFIFAIARIPERERRFVWIAALAPAEVCLFRLAGRGDLADADLADLPDLRVAAIKDYFTTSLLHRWGVPEDHVTLFRDDARAAAIAHLEMGRSDFFLGDRAIFGLALRETGKADRVVRHGVPVLAGQYWLAAHPGTHPDLVRRVREAVHRVESDGRAEAIRRAYMQRIQLP